MGACDSTNGPKPQSYSAFNYYQNVKAQDFLKQINMKKNTQIRPRKVKVVNPNEKFEDYIISEIKIGEHALNKDIRIINSYEEQQRNENNYDFDDDVINEEDIKKCRIFIGNQLIPFSYYFKFTQLVISLPH